MLAGENSEMWARNGLLIQTTTSKKTSLKIEANLIDQPDADDMSEDKQVSAEYDAGKNALTSINDPIISEEIPNLLSKDVAEDGLQLTKE